jgi:hypothetical protein
MVFSARVADGNFVERVKKSSALPVGILEIDAVLVGKAHPTILALWLAER